ncbi:MAG TPA: radical SAM protein [Methanoregulaceae archaeon]|nr:MAG: radical SAM protein [Methanolinea sp.]HON81794.1 radical SAM protein [Methanoregulaceae archaeon]HPD11117.1 radical SAM protein [Methanoregulaceae archaeon]HRT15620.1 radical SAM protein [Methanoregulaceae archaeon]HRU31704.1 radical SAM protein [Methanoregulaceae archaeon]
MRIAEIFRSVQGEGKCQGAPCTFLRLAGCNLACAWCDTPSARSGGVDMTCDEVMQRIAAVTGHRLCITGGEPLMQAEGLLPLVRFYSGRGVEIEIETNGTIDFRPFQPYASICMDVKCPSSGMRSDTGLLAFLSPRDSLRFVVAGREDCEFAARILEEHPVRCEVFFSPVFGSDYRQVADFIVARDLPVRLQVQLHKVVGVP